MKLTPEQSKIVSENEQMIGGYCNFKGLDSEEWYGLLAIELCMSVILYDESKGALSTLFYTRCNNMVSNEITKRNCNKRKNNGICSLDELEEIIPDKCRDEDVDLGWVDAEVMKIVNMKIEGYTQLEIANHFGVGQPYISKTLNKFREEFEGR